MFEISQGGEQPIGTVVLIDHGVGTGGNWIQTIGDSKLGATQLVDVLEPYTVDEPVIVFGGCNVGGTTDYCQAIANGTGGIVIGATVPIRWNPNPWLFAPPLAITIDPPWLKYEEGKPPETIVWK